MTQNLYHIPKKYPKISVILFLDKKISWILNFLKCSHLFTFSLLPADNKQHKQHGKMSNKNRSRWEQEGFEERISHLHIRQPSSGSRLKGATKTREPRSSPSLSPNWPLLQRQKPTQRQLKTNTNTNRTQKAPESVGIPSYKSPNSWFCFGFSNLWPTRGYFVTTHLTFCRSKLGHLR